MSYLTTRLDEKIVELLKGGAVGFMPSDTIYGLSCRALSEKTVNKLHEIKNRQDHKPFIVLASNLEMLNKLSISEVEALPAKKYWPGPITLICRAPQAPVWLRLGGQTLAVRIPDNKKLRDLIDKVGPLVSTSANLENQPPINNVLEAQKLFAEKLDFYVDVGRLTNPPSTLVKVENGKLVVVRQGAIKI